MKALALVIGVLLFGAAPACAETMIVSPPIQVVQSVQAASLPACTSANSGVVFKVTDALLPVLLSTVAGGGAVSVLVQCNGTSFVVG